jgi:Holliday junction DNA helicase RuvA
MIARLRGKVLEISDSSAVIDVQGIGYEVMLPYSVVAQLPPVGSSVDLRIRQIFREDAVTLFGFLESLDLRLFDLLRDVKGCGPKVSLSLIGELGADGIVDALYRQDVKFLTKASGVGPRLAERIVVELKEKIQKEVLLGVVGSAVGAKPAALEASNELIEALMALGYRRNEAEQAAVLVESNGLDLQEQIRLALGGLRR